MSLMFADDFKGYGNDTSFMLNGLYAELTGSLVVDPDPSAGGGYVFGFGFTGTSAVALRRVFPATQTTAGMAFRLWMGHLPAYENKSGYFMFSTAGNSPVFSFFPTTTGAIKVIQGNSGSQLGITPGPVLVANAYNHIEIKAVADAVAGSIEIRVNGVSVLVINGINTGSDFSQMSIEQHYALYENAVFYIKDLVTWNGGGGHNHDFLGLVSVVSMWPDADVDFEWTPSTGTTGFNLVNQAPPTDGVDYITAGLPAPPASVFSMSDLPLNVSTVKGLITQVRARKSDGGDGNIQVGLISAGTEVDGADRPMTTAYTYYEDVIETDPHTGGNWTPASADAATIKVNRTL